MYPFRKANSPLGVHVPQVENLCFRASVSSFSIFPGIQLFLIRIGLGLKNVTVRSSMLRAVLSVFIDLRSAECVCSYYGLRVCSQTNKLN